MTDAKRQKTAIPRRKLGRTDMEVSALGFGARPRMRNPAFCSNLTPIFIGMHRNTPMSPI
jgi:hypothetical protein